MEESRNISRIFNGDVKIAIMEETYPPKKSYQAIKPLYQHFIDFTSNTSMHGLRYLGESGRSLIERLWWLAVFAICIYGCAAYIGLTLSKWKENQVFIGFSHTTKVLEDFPFPAITICPPLFNRWIRNDTYEHYVRRFFYDNQNMTITEWGEFLNAKLSCRSSFFHFNLPNRSINAKTIDVVVENALFVDDFFEKCQWFNGIHLRRSCSGLFKPVFTNRGICYSTNGLNKWEMFSNVVKIHDKLLTHPKQLAWNYDNGYDPTAHKERVFPRRGINNLAKLTVTTWQVDANRTCPERTMSVFVHHPAEDPTPIMDTAVITREKKLNISEANYVVSIKSDVILASQNLRNCKQDQKQCFFADEGNLKLYKIYTRQNCLSECFINKYLKECGCVPYYLPHEEITRLCDYNDKRCISKVEHDWFFGNLHDHKAVCNCPSACNSILYNIDSIESPNNFLPPGAPTSVTFVYKCPEFLARERNSIFDNMDFLANCGGIIALFTGFSVISALEILYFLSLRWICNICRRKNS